LTRRGLLSALMAAAAGAAVIDPERLLWVPGKKLISIPKPVVVDPDYCTVTIWARAGDKWVRQRDYRMAHSSVARLFPHSQGREI
jgi:hypothetical protein